MGKTQLDQWYEQPGMAQKALLHALLTPQLEVNVLEIGSGDRRLMARLEIPLYFENKSLLFAELWQTGDDWGQCKNLMISNNLNSSPTAACEVKRCGGCIPLITGQRSLVCFSHQRCNGKQPVGSYLIAKGGAH